MTTLDVSGMSVPAREPGSESVRLRYFLRIPNVGDRVNPLIVRALSGLEPRFSLDGHLPHLLGVGSLMAVSEPSSLIWGTGVMHPDFGVGKARAGNILALRGKLTATAMRQAGVPVSDVPLGDPGVLAPGILGIWAVPHPRYELGVVPHYVDRSHPAVTRLLAMPSVRDLDVTRDPEGFLQAMADCRAIASSSLHGLIFAEALGLPSLWFQASDDVAGNGFKFHDWFSTTRRPQVAAIRLHGADDPEELARRAEPRESIISSDDLSASFPLERLSEIRDPRICRVSVPTARRPVHPLPVFVISFNRGPMLLRCLSSLHHLNRGIMPVIHDNGSTDAATLDILADLETQGVLVFRREAITNPDELNRVDHTITEFFADWSEPSRYVVTDCDIDMAVADPDALTVFDDLLNMFRKVSCVGPMLRIRDIRPSYPLYSRVMNRHIEQFWHQRPTWVESSRGRIAVQECSIDTTFALHRAGEPFTRLKPALRVYEPYEALHLDWYETDRDANPAYRTTSSGNIAHWNNAAEDKRYGGEPLRYQCFYAVRRTPLGDLEDYVCKVASPTTQAHSLASSFAPTPRSHHDHTAP